MRTKEPNRREWMRLCGAYLSLAPFASLLLCGVLTAKQYFQDAVIQDLATKIYARVDWPWMMNGGPTFSIWFEPVISLSCLVRADEGFQWIVKKCGVVARAWVFCPCGLATKTCSGPNCRPRRRD